MASEQKSFIFAIVFIIVFSGLLVSMPAGLLGFGGSATELLPVNPNLLTDFSETENWTRTSFSLEGTTYYYNYALGGYSWYCTYSANTFTISRKILWIGFIWLGALENCEFFLENGTTRGTTLTMAEIEGDAEDGAIRYDCEFTESGNTAGGFIFYWNSTAYPDPADAWTADELNLLHGMGIDATAAGNIFSLLIALLFLQLPEVPVLVNLLLVTPIWACIIYLIWFVIVNSLPFLGGG